MAYNEEIAGRIKNIVSSWKNTDSKKMFGGVCYLLHGNMFCGVHKDFLILRLGEKGAAEALKSQHTRPFDITGRPMKGWVMMDKEGFESKEELEALLDEARDFLETLPRK
jgi:TfoX/Sxy family transcriptional regulator of competence genes